MKSKLAIFFEKLSTKTAFILGSFWSFSAFIGLTVVWLLLGTVTGFSSVWQLWANTITSLATTAIVLLIQSTVNRDSKAFHIKLDELLRSKKGARTELVDFENMPEEDMNRLLEEFSRLRDKKEKEKQA